MKQPKFLSFQTALSQFGLASFLLFLVIAFQNCTNAVEFSNDKNPLNFQQNGSGYEGKLYVHQDRCNGSSDHVKSAIKDFGSQDGLWLVRENCADLKEWKQVQASEIARSKHDDTILGYQRQAFDLSTTGSIPLKTTAAFCLSSANNQQIEAKVWRPAGQATLLASVSDPSANLTGIMPLMPTENPTPQSTLYQSQPQYLVTVEAFGEMADNTWPLMRLRVDNSIEGEVSVNSALPLFYSFITRQIPGIHNLEIKYMNDAVIQPPGDRNLIIRSISVKAADGTGATTTVDLTKLTPNPVVSNSHYYRPNGDLDISKEIAMSQPVPFPNMSPDLSFALTTSIGSQTSDLSYLPSSAATPVTVPATCYLQPAL